LKKIVEKPNKNYIKKKQIFTLFSLSNF